MPVPDQSQGEQNVRAFSRQGPQRLRSLASRFDVSNSMRVKRSGRGQNDEVHHQIRKEHSRKTSVARVPQLFARGPSALSPRSFGP